MPFVVHLSAPHTDQPHPDQPYADQPYAGASRSEPLVVEADEHRVEGAWHVFRRTTTVMGRPRTVVALRLPVAGVRQVSPG